MKTTNKKFARRCDATGEGMNEGFVFGDGEKYFKHKKDATKYAKEIGYKTLQEAYDDEAYYWTEWEELDGNTYFDAKGKEHLKHLVVTK